MKTTDKILESVKRVASSPVYFYRYYKSVRNQYPTSEALKLAGERTLNFLVSTKDIWK